MRAWLARLVEVYEGERYRRTYGRKADRSTALATLAALRQEREAKSRAAHVA